IEAAVAGNEAAKTAGDEDRSDNEKEIAVWRRLVKEYPADLQAKIFLSGSVRDGYDDAGEPKKGTKEGIAILQEVLKAAPNDSAANHYWIHAVEASARPEQALGCARGVDGDAVSRVAAGWVRASGFEAAGGSADGRLGGCAEDAGGEQAGGQA